MLKINASICFHQLRIVYCIFFFRLERFFLNFLFQSKTFVEVQVRWSSKRFDCSPIGDVALLIDCWHAQENPAIRGKTDPLDFPSLLQVIDENARRKPSRPSNSTIIIGVDFIILRIFLKPMFKRDFLSSTSHCLYFQGRSLTFATGVVLC